MAVRIYRDSQFVVQKRSYLRLGTASAAIAVLFAGHAMAEGRYTYNLYGVPGLVDMPTAFAQEDATLSTTVSNMGDSTRTTLSFQITPRLSGSFRYSAISNFDNPSSVDGRYYDRSFDVRYQILTEGQYRPAVTIGLQDFIGTGLYGAEYIVASKELVPGLQVTGGLGWGRLGSFNSIGNTGTRPTELLGEGGIPNYDRWFLGDVGAFGGISYSPNERLSFAVEYSSDDYVEERASGGFEKTSPWNYGMSYTFKSGTQLSLYHAYGTELGAQLTIQTNARKALNPGGAESAPLPVARRAASASKDLGWTTEPAQSQTAKATLTTTLAREGLALEGLKLEPTRATLRLNNLKYGETPQAIGRAARAMTRIMPASIEEFVIIPTVNGIPTSAVKISRSDMENLENEKADTMLAKTQIVDAFGMNVPLEDGIYPKFRWSLAPYVALSMFDPDSPVRADLGARLSASYRFTPNIVLSGSFTKKLGGNLSSSDREDESSLPRVRTDYAEYSKEGDPAIEHLTLAAYGRPGKDFYSRVTVGYLEQMYAGISGELLWKPVDSRLALGIEANYVQQREFDQLFGLRDYDVFTGHASAYYAFGNGFHGQLDVGRYLAGDYGATLSVDREFANGWRVGAYATVTDVTSEDFGEGSFDKGIRVSIPLDWALGTPSRRKNNVTIQSLTRDGGARLNVNGRLYGQVRDYHQPQMAKTWGKFWR